MLVVVASACAVVVVFLVWSLIDADSVPSEVAFAAVIALAVIAVNALRRLVMLLRNRNAFR